MPMPQPNSASGDQKLNDTSPSSRAATNAAVQEHTFTMGDITALNVHHSTLDSLTGKLADNAGSLVPPRRPGQQSGILHERRAEAARTGFKSGPVRRRLRRHRQLG